MRRPSDVVPLHCTLTTRMHNIKKKTDLIQIDFFYQQTQNDRF